MNKSYITVELVFFALKTPTSLQKRQYSVMLQWNFDGANLVYEFAMAHLNNRECVVQDFETYGYTRKGALGDTRKGGIGG